MPKMKSTHEKILNILRESNSVFEDELEIIRYYPLNDDCLLLETEMYYDNTLYRIIICKEPHSKEDSYSVEVQIFDPAMVRDTISVTETNLSEHEIYPAILECFDKLNNNVYNLNEGISDPYLKKRVAPSDRDKIYVNTQPFLEYALKQRLETFQKIVNKVNLKKVSSENIEKMLLKLKAYIKEGFRNIPNSCFHKIAEGISFQVVEETKDNSLAGYLITTTGECLFRDEKLAEIRISNDGKLEFTLVYKLETTGRTFALDLF